MAGLLKATQIKNPLLKDKQKIGLYILCGKTS